MWICLDQDEGTFGCTWRSQHLLEHNEDFPPWRLLKKLQSNKFSFHNQSLHCFFNQKLFDQRWNSVQVLPEDYRISQDQRFGWFQSLQVFEPKLLKRVQRIYLILELLWKDPLRLIWTYWSLTPNLSHRNWLSITWLFDLSFRLWVNNFLQRVQLLLLLNNVHCKIKIMPYRFSKVCQLKSQELLICQWTMLEIKTWRDLHSYFHKLS